MIWMTAKSTEVRSRHRPRPTCASGFVGAVAGAAQPTAGVATTLDLDADGGLLDRSGRVARGGEGGREVVLKVLEILEARPTPAAGPA